MQTLTNSPRMMFVSAEAKRILEQVNKEQLASMAIKTLFPALGMKEKKEQDGRTSSSKPE